MLSHVSPDPYLAGHYTRFCVPYRVRNRRYHKHRMQFLRPLSMTCRAMRLRLLPWIWERLEVFGCLKTWGLPFGIPAVPMSGVIILNALCTDTFLATNVKYSCALLCPWAGANSSPSMKDHDSASPSEPGGVHLPFVRQMSQVSTKSTHA